MWLEVRTNYEAFAYSTSRIYFLLFHCIFTYENERSTFCRGMPKGKCEKIEKGGNRKNDWVCWLAADSFHDRHFPIVHKYLLLYKTCQEAMYSCKLLKWREKKKALPLLVLLLLLESYSTREELEKKHESLFPLFFPKQKWNQRIDRHVQTESRRWADPTNALQKTRSLDSEWKVFILCV